MIVTKGGVQGNYAEKYHVGISIDSADQILGEIKKWIETVNFVEYQENCKKLLEEFLNDYESFFSPNFIRKFLKSLLRGTLAYEIHFHIFYV